MKTEYQLMMEQLDNLSQLVNGEGWEDDVMALEWAQGRIAKLDLENAQLRKQLEQTND